MPLHNHLGLHSNIRNILDAETGCANRDILVCDLGDFFIEDDVGVLGVALARANAGE